MDLLETGSVTLIPSVIFYYLVFQSLHTASFSICKLSSLSCIRNSFIYSFTGNWSPAIPAPPPASLDKWHFQSQMDYRYWNSLPWVHQSYHFSVSLFFLSSWKDKKNCFLKKEEGSNTLKKHRTEMIQWKSSWEQRVNV